MFKNSTYCMKISKLSLEFKIKNFFQSYFKPKITLCLKKLINHKQDIRGSKIIFKSYDCKNQNTIE